MKNKIFIFVAIGLIFGIVTGCGGKTVKRTEVKKTIDLSGRWNDTDSRFVAEEMINDCLKRPWLDKFYEEKRKEPVVIVGTVVNRSHEHINSEVFSKDLEKSLLNSGKVKFVASREEREEVREERSSQQVGLTAKETVKPIGFETGADFMLKGSINSIKDEVKGKYVILYQVNLELIDLITNQKVWIGEKEIKKLVTKSAFSL